MNVEQFRNDLLSWFRANARDLPWRRTRDPYRILLSEVMLQQTRVDQVMPYYERFLTTFPSIEALAEASMDDVLRVWEGLGYYARARNLHRAAKAIAVAGAFPATYETLLKQPGIGPYTAAAVASIAFDEPRAVLDGNVVRVLARVLAWPEDTRRPSTRRCLQEHANTLVAPSNAGAFNEAIMELGATVCMPRSPACASCPVKAYCEARRSGTQDAYPVVSARAPIPHHQVALALLNDGSDRLFIQQRPTDGLLGGLWEFPGGKQEPDESLEDTCRRELLEELGIQADVGTRRFRLTHAYTHFKVTLHVFPCTVRSGIPASPLPWRWATLEELDAYAFPRANRKLIEQLRASRLP